MCDDPLFDEAFEKAVELDEIEKKMHKLKTAEASTVDEMLRREDRLAILQVEANKIKTWFDNTKSFVSEDEGSNVSRFEHDLSMQKIANEVAEKYKKEYSRSPTKARVAEIMTNSGLVKNLSASTVERRIRKKW